MIGSGRVIKVHKRSYDDPMYVKKGDVVRIDKREMWNERDEWVWCVAASTKEGWMPAEFLEITANRGIVLRDYNAIELTVAIGEDVFIFDEAAGWYWVQNKHDKRGWVPVECIALDFM